MEREIQTMRIYFLEEFQSADSARSTALYKQPTRATKEIISIMSTFRVITKFDIRSHHYTACVYSMEREVQAMRIYFLEKFQKCRQRAIDSLSKGLQGPQKI